MQRRRYASRRELAEQLATLADLGDDEAVRVLDALDDLGVPVDHLVKITVNED